MVYSLISSLDIPIAFFFLFFGQRRQVIVVLSIICPLVMSAGDSVGDSVGLSVEDSMGGSVGLDQGEPSAYRGGSTGTPVLCH